jgi:D-aminopeptidase
MRHCRWFGVPVIFLPEKLHLCRYQEKLPNIETVTVKEALPVLYALQLPVVKLASSSNLDNQALKTLKIVKSTSPNTVRLFVSFNAV